jgi:hypothetical protein
MNKTLNNLDNHNSRMNTTEGRGKGGLRQALPQNTVTGNENAGVQAKKW